MKTNIGTVRNNSKILLDYESHYVRKDGMTYCGKEIPKVGEISNTIEIVTCNKCVNIFISKGNI